MSKNISSRSARLNAPGKHPEFFDDRTALQLTQAFGQEAELEPLLALLFAQQRATAEVRGLRYVYRPLGIDLNYGERADYEGEYNLTFRDLPLGTLTLYFANGQNEQSIQTCEDLVSLAFTSIRNAVTTLKLRNKPQGINSAERAALATVNTPREKHDTAPGSSQSGEARHDALILLGLDHFPTIQSRDGEEWAQVLMSSVHEQIREGLRSADGVYHIGDDLIAVLLPNTSSEQAEQVAKKIRTLVASLHLRGDPKTEQLTACMGLADATHAKTAEDVMSHAQCALAAARAQGSNQILYYQPELAETQPFKSG
ncbi:MAG: diguanylate cyclase [Pseudomonadales bacterium]|jgi:diguanylate cyclase (GGDEF)-like protein|nr:diguanylate cyclase [Pseudomonadales bacterium]